MFTLIKSTKNFRGTIRSAQRTARLTQNAFRSIHSDSKQVRVLVTGATGQIGTELVPTLRRLYGAENVIASDIREAPRELAGGPFEILDVMDAARMKTVFEKYGINRVYHLASLLSAVGEKNPHLAMKLNTRGIENILELARQPINPNFPMRVFAPSTIAVFGPSTPPNNVPDTTIMRPTTIYGVTKVYLELLGEYYYRKFGVDFRSVRFPGIISSVGAPGGGTTDYAVEIYHEAVKSERTPGGTTFKCFLKPDSALPMMYMSDALECTIQLMEADNKVLTQRIYNVQGMSFSPAEVYAAVHKHVPSMKIDYKPDFRQQIADSWPRSLDDSLAKRDWKYNPKFDLEAMTAHMLDSLRRTLPHPEAAATNAKSTMKQAMQ